LVDLLIMAFVILDQLLMLLDDSPRVAAVFISKH
jgi:hypothetical protein